MDNNYTEKFRNPSVQIPALVTCISMFTLIGYFVDKLISRIDMFREFRLQITIFLTVLIWDALLHQMVKDVLGRDFCQIMNLKEGECMRVVTQSVAIHATSFTLIGSVIHFMVKVCNRNANLDEDHLLVKILATTALLVACTMVVVNPTIELNLNLPSFDTSSQVTQK